MKCRHCDRQLKHLFLDLGFAPPSNGYLNLGDLDRPELYFPLKVYVCDGCWLVQTLDYARAEELFRSDYAYFSSTSTTWLAHASDYTEMICRRIGLDGNSLVVEVASNDGYLLKNFIKREIPCLGIEPTLQTAKAAELQNIPVQKAFFSPQVAEQLVLQHKQADLIIGNNVYAHVPDINGFTRALQMLLKPGGTITLEFQYVLRLIENNQFDTIYHEHFSYHSLRSVINIFQAHGLRVFDVEELSTHGGSLRIYGCHEKDCRQDAHSVQTLLEEEKQNGLYDVNTYKKFQYRADRIKDDLLDFLIKQKRQDKVVAAYGAAAKGNTLLNYAGVKPDLLPFVCDAAQSKQGKYLPGSHIPILPPEALLERSPDYVVILPWNIADEVKRQNQYLAEHGTQFVTFIPELRIL